MDRRQFIFFSLASPVVVLTPWSYAHARQITVGDPGSSFVTTGSASTSRNQLGFEAPSETVSTEQVSDASIGEQLFSIGLRAIDVGIGVVEFNSGIAISGTGIGAVVGTFLAVDGALRTASSFAALSLEVTALYSGLTESVESGIDVFSSLSLVGLAVIVVSSAQGDSRDVAVKKAAKFTNIANLLQSSKSRISDPYSAKSHYEFYKDSVEFLDHFRPEVNVEKSDTPDGTSIHTKETRDIEDDHTDLDQIENAEEIPEFEPDRYDDWGEVWSEPYTPIVPH